MKKLLSVFLLLILSVGLFASSSDLFSYNKDQVNSTFEQLTQLENAIINGQPLPLTLNNLSTSSGLTALYTEGGPPLGVPSWVWGCCFGVAGILVVYLVTKDNAETKKAFIGCAIGEGAALVVYVIYYAIVLSTYTTY